SFGKIILLPDSHVDKVRDTDNTKDGYKELRQSIVELEFHEKDEMRSIIAMDCYHRAMINESFISEEDHTIQEVWHLCDSITHASQATVKQNGLAAYTSIRKFINDNSTMNQNITADSFPIDKCSKIIQEMILDYEKFNKGDDVLHEVVHEAYKNIENHQIQQPAAEAVPKPSVVQKLTKPSAAKPVPKASLPFNAHEEEKLSQSSCTISNRTRKDTLKNVLLEKVTVTRISDADMNTCDILLFIHDSLTELELQKLIEKVNDTPNVSVGYLYRPDTIFDLVETTRTITLLT
ncbi:hypothetical protein HDU92_006842, partial [Lobulomyces angularis]